jgi:type VI secretion system protein ImpM
MNMVTLQAQRLCYFGKLPARGDFVKGAYNPQLLQVLDQWLSGTMELLSEDPRWKLIYDELPEVRFICLGSRNSLAIAGHVRPSRDASSRRYPFVTAVALDVKAPLEFMSGAPLLLDECWHRMARGVDELVSCAELDLDLKRFESMELAVGTAFAGGAPRAAYDRFLKEYSLLRVEQMLNTGDGGIVSMGRLILALGLLLQPVLTSAASHLEKGLTLPLPRDPVLQPLVASYWLDLIAPFFAHADFELMMFISSMGGQPRLIIGFNGMSPRSLQAVLHPQVYAEQNIQIDNPEWVQESIHSSHTIYKFVSYLDQPQLPLGIIQGAFREAFGGGGE